MFPIVTLDIGLFLFWKNCGPFEVGLHQNDPFFQYQNKTISTMTNGNIIILGTVPVDCIPIFLQLHLKSHNIVIFGYNSLTGPLDLLGAVVGAVRKSKWIFDLNLMESNFGQKSQYCVIWGKITRILTKWLQEMIPNMKNIPNFPLEIYSFWYWEREI